ncbi:threonine synthase-like 2 [Lineus longissimus]|uniref:threonine synthase-like 2 n=1 Tax=Lineus longissimus TaxID=88925 RepID=UPI002B4EC1B2
MKYLSTRGSRQGMSFEDALMSPGFLPDGGLILPETIPNISLETLTQWSKLSYPELAKEIVSLYVSEDEIPRVELNALLDNAFKRIRHEDVCPVAKLKDGLNVHELFHGITYAFKDLALSCVGQFMEYFLNKRRRHITVLVGTSGDTGSAALEAVRGLKWIDTIVLLPKGRCSRIQELMMTTVIEENCHIYRVDGTSDDLDEPIKACFLDEAFSKKHNLCSVNSINWARIMVQIAHFVYGYFKVCRSVGETVEIVVPTGACGNVTGGTIAWKMGVPVKLTTAVNSNDIVARTLRDGDWSVPDEVEMTISPAMDIQNPYNMQRLFYLLSDGDTDFVNQLMDEFEKSKSKMQLPKNLMNKVHDLFNAFCADDQTTRATMKRCWEENGYLLCPHTATAVAYHYESLASRSASDPPRICIATASPAKFAETLEGAGLTPQLPDDVKALYTMPTKSEEMKKEDNWYKMLKEKIEEITEKHS